MDAFPHCLGAPSVIYRALSFHTEHLFLNTEREGHPGQTRAEAVHIPSSPHTWLLAQGVVSCEHCRKRILS